MISFLDGKTTPIGGHEDIKRIDFVYFGIEEIRRSEMMNDEWMRKAKQTDLLLLILMLMFDGCGA